MTHCLFIISTKEAGLMIMLTILVYFLLTAIYDMKEADYYAAKVRHYERMKLDEKKLKQLQEIKEKAKPRRKATRSRTVVNKRGYRNETITLES